MLLLLVCQLLIGAGAAVQLAFTATAMQPLLGGGPAADRLRSALPALLVIALAAAVTRVATALSSYADGRITPRLTTGADSALVEAVCRAEAAAYAEPGFADRQEAAEMGVTRSQMMVRDATRFTAALVRMVTASGVLSVLHPLMFPLLVLAVVPAGAGAVLSARVTYETHYANVGDRNVRGMMRWWLTTSELADELRANTMRPYLHSWYRAMCDRVEGRELEGARPYLLVTLLAASLAGLFTLGMWAALAALALSGAMSAAIAGTAIVASQTAGRALNAIVRYGAVMFHHGLYLATTTTSSTKSAP